MEKKQYFYSTKTASPVLRLCTQQLNKQGNKSSVFTLVIPTASTV